MPQSQDKPLFFVLGPAGHGKSTVRRLIMDKTGFTGESCSDVIYAMLSFLTGKSEGELRQIPKETYRPTLIAFGDWITGHSKELPQFVTDHFTDEGRKQLASIEQNVREPAALVRMLFLAGAQVIDGIRRPKEFAMSLSHLVWCGYTPIVIWVEASGKPVIHDNTTITKEFARPRFIIDNNDSLDALEQEVERVLRELGWRPEEENAKASEVIPTILNSKGDPIIEDEVPNITTKA